MLRESIAVAIATLCLAPVAGAALVITEVQAQTTAGTAATINGDWFELTNTGPAAASLAGLSWGDTDDTFASGETNFFPAISLAAGASLIVSEELNADEAAFRANWANLPAGIVVLNQDDMVDDATADGDFFSGLSGGGDGVFLYDSVGTLLSSYDFTAAEFVRGTTFEQSGAGADLGLSTVGANGAFQATNLDVGSPGVAVVPEPATLAALSLAGLMARRRRRA